MISHDPEANRTLLRTTLSTLGTQLAHLGQADLLATYASLVTQLDLGPEPVMRACPVCHEPCRAAATRCGGCWSKLTPIAGA